MADPIAPIGSEGLRSSVAGFDAAAEETVQATAGSASVTGDAADATLVNASPDVDNYGKPLKEYPPSFVFAPGFLHADRRGIVAYPGLEFANPMIRMLLTKRSVDANAVTVRAAQDLYDNIVALGKPNKHDQ